MPERLLWVCAGGALGSGARYLIGVWLKAMESPYPLGTWSVNIAGSFLLGFLAAHFVASEGAPWHLALTTGLMGGFTTYSTFSLDTLRFLQKGDATGAFVNVAVTLLVCLGATFLGVHLGTRS
ncbi:MAG: fluoride efflux transporter CrcB [Myxococcota bacterium]